MYVHSSFRPPQNLSAARLLHLLADRLANNTADFLSLSLFQAEITDVSVGLWPVIFLGADSGGLKLRLSTIDMSHSSSRSYK
jgi:hypothetical protein